MYADVIVLFSTAQLNYVIAPGLYIISSDMVLKVGKVDGYNNTIIIATEDMKPGLFNVNNAILSHNKAPPLGGKPDNVNRVGKSTNPAKHQASIANKASNDDSNHSKTSKAHEDNKTSFAIGFSLVVVLVVVYSKR
jgi:hypothetical protein